jgi:hypothetical protein
MTIKNFRFTFMLLALCAFAGTAAAQSGFAPQLEMTATVQTAMQLNISTGDTGAEVVDGGGGAFSIAFVNVNGLGLGSPAAGVSVFVNGSGALYKSPISLTPIFSGYTTEKANVSVLAGTSGDEDLAREGSSSISPSSTVSGITPAPVIVQAESGSANERWVGFFIPRVEAAGGKTATLIYTLTVVDDES